MDPKISIIIPFFNAEKTLKRAVNSVLSQSSSAWELILVNDGSTDDSEVIACSFLQDERISYIFQENNGVSVARNTGASKAKGDWLLFLDSDDALEPKALEVFSDGITKNSDNKVIRGGFRRVLGGDESISIPSAKSPQSTLSGSFVIDHNLFSEIGGFDGALTFSENTELFHRIVLNDQAIGYVSKVVLVYFESKSGGSKNLQNMIDSLTLILEKHDQTLSTHVKHLYHQIIGVNWMRFRNFSEARNHLWRAVVYKPMKLMTWGRLGLAHFPFLAKRLYTETVKYD